MTTSKKRPRAAIYARISADDDTFDKPAEQITACRKLAERQGYEVVDVFDDGTVSAYKGIQRPEYLRLSAAVGAGEIDVVLASEQTRLARIDAERAAFQTICKDRGTAWHFASSGQYLDLAKPSDALNAGLVGLFAVYESDLKKLRLAARYAAERAQRKPLWGPRPFGYEVDRMTIRESEAGPLREAYDTILAMPDDKVHLSKIVRDWRERGIVSAKAEGRDKKKKIKRPGGIPFTAPTLRALLLRKRNAGILEMGKGEDRVEMKAAWPGIVSVETFDAVAARLTDPSRREQTGNRKKYLSAGFVQCACGAPLRTKSANGSAYLQCLPKYNDARRSTSVGVHSSAPMEATDEAVRKAVIDAIAASPPPEDDPAVVGQLASLETELSRLRGLQSVQMDFLSDGIAVDVVRSKLQKLDREIGKLTEHRAELESKRQTTVNDLRAGLYSRDDNGRVRFSLDDAGEYWAAIAERFDALSVQEQTTQAKEYVTVHVQKGRAPVADRLVVRHLKTPHLDRTPESEAAEDWAESMSWVEEEFEYMVAELQRPAELDESRLRLHRHVVGYLDAALHRRGR